MVPLFNVLLVLSVSAPGHPPAWKVPTRSLSCVDACRWTDSACVREEICCDDHKYNCKVPVQEGCRLEVKWRRTTVEPSRPMLPAEALSRSCTSTPSLKKIWLEKNVWIDFEAEGRHGYRGVHWRMEFFGPYDAEQRTTQGHALVEDSAACSRYSIPGETGSPVRSKNSCCVPAFFDVNRIKTAYELTHYRVELDGRFELLDSSRIEVEKHKRSAPVTDLEEFCWKPEDLPGISVGSPQFYVLEGFSVIPDTRPAREPREAYPGHRGDCEKDDSKAIPHFLQVRLEFSNKQTQEYRIPFCVKEFEKKER